MRWNALAFLLAITFLTATGCAQRCWLNKEEYEEFHRHNGLPLHLESDPTLAYKTTENYGDLETPAIVTDPDRRRRYISLAECIAIALERGSTGIQSVRQFGFINEDLLSSPNGFPFVQSDSIRVLSLSPAITGTAIEAALARFDTKFVTSVNTGTTDQPVQGFNSFNNGDNGRLVSSLVKPLPTGGMAAITFSNQYQLLSSPPSGFPLLNPAYTTRAQVTFEHPLWQGSGVDINQLLSRPPLLGNQLSQIHPEASQFYNGHPLNIQNEGAGNAFTPSGILVARTRFDQSRAELERVVNFLLVNVEFAYWNLYGAYVSLYSTEQALRFGYETWKIAKSKFEAGAFAIERLAQSRGQFEQFRGDRVQALGRVLEAERVLRSLLGLPHDHNERLVPVDSPTLAPFVPDWHSARQEALALRPELVLSRQELRALQYDLMVQQNFLKPDLRLVSQFGINGLGSRLDGDGQIPDTSGQSAANANTITRFRSDNAFRVLASSHYNDWSVGLTANFPIGYRFEHAAVRRSKLALTQGFLALQREEYKALFFLEKAYRDIFENYKVVEARRAQREAFALQLDARFKLFRAGRQEATIEFVLQAQQQWANALNQEYQAIVAYNNALAAFQFAKGTIMQHDNVAISEGPLPQCAVVKASDNEKERSKALVIRERANYVPHGAPGADHGVPWMPQLPGGVPPSVVSLRETRDGQPLPVPKDLEEKIPAPKANGSLPSATLPAVPTTLGLPQPRAMELPTSTTGLPTPQSIQTGPTTPSSIQPLLVPQNLPTVPALPQPAAQTPALPRVEPLPTPPAAPLSH
jgi:outer membrane protein TolC